MADRLLLPPPVPPEKAAEAWFEVLDQGEALLRAGFAQCFRPDQVEERCPAWCREQITENDRRLIHMLTELSRRESGNAG